MAAAAAAPPLISMAASAAAATPLEEASTLPPAFYCPISLDLMTDPVTLSSGITYDRASIQSWFASGNRTCPVTRQPLLPHPFFIPNHTLLRIIRSWCHSQSNECVSDSYGHPAASPIQPEESCVRVGQLCIDALLNLGLLDENTSSAITADLLPREQTPSLLISLLSHYTGAAHLEAAMAEHICVAALREEALAERVCEEAVAVLSILPLSPHHLSSLSTARLFNYLSHLLHITHRHSTVRNSASLLAQLISQHPSPKPFLKSLSPASLSAIASGLADFLKSSTHSPFLAQLILHSLCLVCKSSRNALLSLADATCAALAHAALAQLLHSARQTNSVISDTALHLLKVFACCAEGRAAIAGHAFAVPTIAKFLQRSTSEAAMESAVFVLWKLCRYSSEERVRRQAMAACVPSKLVLIMQASHCSAKAKAKAGALVRLVIGEAKSTH